MTDYLTSPIPVLYPKGYMPMMYLKVRYALADRNTTFMFSVFMTNLVDMMNYIKRNWEMLVQDIRTGTFNDDVQIYGASESMMATCTHIEEPEFALLCDSCFYKFLPADAPDDFTDTLNIDQLEVGKEYEFIIEPDSPLDPSKCGEYLKILEKHLCAVNPVYEECLDTNEIAHGILYLQQMQTHALWRDVKVHKGTSLNQVKPVRVLDTSMKKFFYGLLKE